MMRVEFETSIDVRLISKQAPIEIYDIFTDAQDDEVARWQQRLADLGPSPSEAKCVTFASSSLRGWGDREKLEGLKVICTRLEVLSAPSDFRADLYSRPRIEGS